MVNLVHLALITNSGRKRCSDRLTTKKKFDWGWASVGSLFGISIGVALNNPAVIVVAAIVVGVIFGCEPFLNVRKT